MTPIFTLTLNPALDLATSVPRVVPGPKLRGTAPRVDPGGGGINVSRAIAALGGHSHAIIALGGPTGERLRQRLDTETITCTSLTAPGNTRESLTVTETSTGLQFRFVLPGVDWASADVENAIALTAKTVSPGGILVISGSQPPGVPVDFTARLCARLPEDTQVTIDTSGAALAQLTAHPVPGIEVLRMDSDEAEILAGTSLQSRPQTADFASSLIVKGLAKQVIIARGPDGSVLAEAGRRLFCKAADVPVKSKVGAGDSFVAGWVLARANGMDTAQALARGVAAASAAVMTDATELCHRDDAERLIADCPVSVI